MAVKFNGSGDILGVVDLPAGAFTMTMWVKQAAVTAGAIQNIFVLTDGGLGHFLALYAENGTGSHVFIDGPAGAEAGSPGSLAIGGWTHLALVYNGTSATGYLNATGAWSLSLSVSYGAPAYTLLGADGNGYFNGAEADVKMWSAALSAAEVATEYQSSAPQRTSNLWAYWTLDDVADLTDRSGNGRTLALFGSSPTTDASGPDTLGQDTVTLGSETSSVSVVSSSQDTPELYGRPRLAARQMVQLLAQ